MAQRIHAEQPANLDDLARRTEVNRAQLEVLATLEQRQAWTRADAAKVCGVLVPSKISTAVRDQLPGLIFGDSAPNLAGLCQADDTLLPKPSRPPESA